MKHSQKRGEPCRDCGRRLRLQRDSAEEYPNTLPHAAHGLCFTCYRLRKHLGESVSEYDPPPKPLIVHGHDSADDQERTNAATTQAWLNARRSKGIPVEGVPA